jgi:hypothetical protein
MDGGNSGPTAGGGGAKAQEVKMRAAAWGGRNNPFGRVQGLMSPRQAKLFRFIMVTALFASLMSLLSTILDRNCFSTMSFIGIAHVFTVLFILCDFIVSPYLYAMFSATVVAASVLTIFIRSGEELCGKDIIIADIFQIVLNLLIIYWLMDLEPQLGATVKGFVTQCQCSNPSQGAPQAGRSNRTPMASVRWQPAIKQANPQAVAVSGVDAWAY